MLAHVHSYGCQQNVSDGEKIKGLLAIMGYTFCDTPNEADIVIYNTCAVRENAEDRVFGNIGELKHNKERNPEMIIGLCGCMMQQEHISQKIKKSYPQVDIVFGTHVLTKLPEMIYKTLTSHKRQFDISDKDVQIVENMPVVRDKSSAKANLPIMYGCNNFCTYCIVPYVRGRERSRKSVDIINEFRSLVADGFKEITLLGQNVNSYGKGLDEDIDFSKLLRLLNEIEGEFRIRFMSSHPKDATFELIDAIADCDKVCKHFHLPIQSGSNRVLSLMNRKYTTESYQKLIEYARKRIPDIAFTSDIIIGFPSETREDFNETLNVIKQVRFDSLFSFIYSKRVGTAAALMEDLTSLEEKSEFFSELLAAQKEIGREKYQSCVGKSYQVLVDGEGRSGPEYLTGRTDGYMIVDFKGDKSLIGQFVTVKITNSLGWALQGEII
ncbi:MAG: tRNA (N6-isopentenyl adenosine(37)-C2)-methylthiotransferase MiaB [Oscillospiraceae bacterium]